jgi:uncharacterized protein YbjT (DUF2867 family)
VARALIVGCGCRGRELGERLRARDLEVRGTSRRPDGLQAIEAAGLEAAEADPDQPGTILDLCRDVAVVVWLLGSAQGEPEAVEAIHGPRLERLLEKLVDSPVRGFAYEGTEGGRKLVQRAAATWHLPVTLIDDDGETDGWAERTADSVTGLLTG